MIEDSALKKILRDDINNEKMDFPKELDIRIKTVISELPERRRKQFPWKSTMVAASLALILTTSIIIFKVTKKDDLLAIINPPQAMNTTAPVSNQVLINKFKLDGYIIEKIPEDSAKIKSGFSMASACKKRSYENLEELIDASDIIIEGEVLAVRYFDYNNQFTYTESKLRVIKSYNDEVSAGDIVTFCESGGFTTQYNMIQMSGAKEKFGENYYEICKTTPEEEEKAKDIKVYNGGFYGGTIMQPSDKVILFGNKAQDSLIGGTYFNPLGGSEGKFVINDNSAERIIPKGESTPSFKMSTNELSNKITDIIKSNRTAVNVPKISGDGINIITIKQNFNGIKQKVITKKEDIERILTYINTIDYKYSSDLDWSGFGYTVEFKGDKEYFIGFNGTRIKYNDRWYLVKIEDIKKVGIDLEKLYNSMNYKEGSL